jgi:hypothetical protein
MLPIPCCSSVSSCVRRCSVARPTSVSAQKFPWIRAAWVLWRQWSSSFYMPLCRRSHAFLILTFVSVRFESRSSHTTYVSLHIHSRVLVILYLLHVIQPGCSMERTEKGRICIIKFLAEIKFYRINQCCPFLINGNEIAYFFSWKCLYVPACIIPIKCLKALKRHCYREMWYEDFRNQYMEFYLDEHNPGRCINCTKAHRISIQSIHGFSGSKIPYLEVHMIHSGSWRFNEETCTFSELSWTSLAPMGFQYYPPTRY